MEVWNDENCRLLRCCIYHSDSFCHCMFFFSHMCVCVYMMKRTYYTYIYWSVPNASEFVFGDMLRGLSTRDQSNRNDAWNLASHCFVQIQEGFFVKRQFGWLDRWTYFNKRLAVWVLMLWNFVTWSSFEDAWRKDIIHPRIGPLTINGWNMYFLYWNGPFYGDMLVFGSAYSSWIIVFRMIALNIWRCRITQSLELQAYSIHTPSYSRVDMQCCLYCLIIVENIG